MPNPLYILAVWYADFILNLISVKCFIISFNLYFFIFQAVFERLVDIICDKMSESLDSDPTLNTNKGTRLDNAQPSNVNCNC